ncbi:MAG: hypothetical protein PHS54_02450 [Clostridia bacterium]|nr:hypothetical protein [Clostridia bacterium]
MPIKKIDSKKTKTKSKKDTTKTVEKKVPSAVFQQKIEKEQENRIPNELIEDPNISPIFDVFLYRELFMSLKQKLDALFDKREKSDKDSNAYDEAVYNITTSAINECGPQDFLSYCYKRGKYDFCLMNYEKFMKWSLLAAANGNAFTLSKLQVFLASSVDNVLNLENHSYMIDFLDLTPENYYTFLIKLLSEEIVKNLNISAESLIKMPEVYQEETDELLRVFDNAKITAVESVKETLKNAIDQLVLLVKKSSDEEKTLKEKNRLEAQSFEEAKQEPDEMEIKEEVKEPVKRPKIKKFRW